jgi:hypothetical protein
VTPAQIDCFGEYVETQECGVPPGKTASTPQVTNRSLETIGQRPCPSPGVTDRGEGFMAGKGRVWVGGRGRSQFSAFLCQRSRAVEQENTG